MLPTFWRIKHLVSIPVGKQSLNLEQDATIYDKLYLAVRRDYMVGHSATQCMVETTIALIFLLWFCPPLTKAFLSWPLDTSILAPLALSSLENHKS